MAIQLRTQLKNWFLTGAMPTQQQFWDWLDSFIHQNELPGGSFVDLVGNWDGSNSRVFLNVAHTDIYTTSAPKLGGLLMVEQDGAGARTISANGTNLDASAGVSAVTIYMLVQKPDGSLGFVKDPSFFGIGAPPAPDTTPPTVTFQATTSTNIRASFNEAMLSVDLSEFVFDNGSPVVPTAVTYVSGFDYDFTVSGLTITDTITAMFTSAHGTKDLAGNDLVTFTSPQSVTNSISSGVLGYLTMGSFVGTVTESPAHQINISGAATTSYMRFVESMAGNGRVQCEIPVSGSDGAGFVLDHKPAVDDHLSPFDCLVFPYSGTYYFNEGVYTSPTNSTIAVVAGHLLQYVRTGVKVKPQYSPDGGATWINIIPGPTGEFAGNYAATMYCKVIEMVGAGVIKNVQAIGFV